MRAAHAILMAALVGGAVYMLAAPASTGSKSRLGDGDKVAIPQDWADLGKDVSTGDISHDHSNGAATEEVKRLRAQVAELVEDKQKMSSNLVKFMGAPRAANGAGADSADLGSKAADLTVKVAAMSRQLKEAEAASASIVKKAMEQKEITDAALAKSERELALHKDLLKVASGGAGGGGGGSSSSASAAVGGESKAPTDFHAGISDWVNKHATPGEVSLFYRVKQSLGRIGLAATQTGLDAVQPKPGEHQIMECARENGRCKVLAKCADDDGMISVIYGKTPTEKMAIKKVKADAGQVYCSSGTFGGDPAHGSVKSCWVSCAYDPTKATRVATCSGGAQREWAQIDLCGSAAGAGAEEAKFQEAVEPFCSSSRFSPGMKVWVDCDYRQAYYNAVLPKGSSIVKPSNKHWIDRAWVTFFKGPAHGMNHAMMVSNLIRSVHLFSKEPIVIYVVGTPHLSIDWDPAIFPRLIVLHADPIETMNDGQGGVSFNFNKFRSMMLRIKVGVQLDADMINGPNCDRLFDATEKEITASYPYPIMPVHWMTRYDGKAEGMRVDGYTQYATAYPGDPPTRDPHWPPRQRWAHCHPTWTWHALPFIADALMCKMDMEIWRASARVQKGLGHSAPEPNPKAYMNEDEDLLNILLWRHKAPKQWCKWDVEPGLYRSFLAQSTSQTMMPDKKWYPGGVPLVYLSMHNTKETVETDKLLKTMIGGASDKYLYFNHKYYANAESLKAANDLSRAPCTLV